MRTLRLALMLAAWTTTLHAEDRRDVAVVVWAFSAPERGLVISDPKLLSVPFIVCAPAELAGSQFWLLTNSVARADVRQKFPSARAFQMHLPTWVAERLREQTRAREQIEQQIDRDESPIAISHEFALPRVRISELREDPKPLRIHASEPPNQSLEPTPLTGR